MVIGPRKNNKCPRCQGFVIVDRDQHGWYEQCLYCGYVRDLEKVEIEKMQRSQQERGKT